MIRHPTRHYHSATHDLRYDLLDPKWVKIFLSSAKKWKDKEKTIQYGFDQSRRYIESARQRKSVHEKFC